MPTVDNAFLDAVSCVSADACVAVGSYDGPGGVTRPFADVGSTSTLTASYPIVPSPRARSTRLEDVSCVSATLCVAVGAYQLGGQQRSLVETFDGRRWHPQADALPNSYLTSVTCATATFCVAVANRETPTKIETWDGQAWSLAFSSPDGSFVRLNGVSCRSATSCVAVGSEYDDATSRYQPAAVVWDGSAWTLQLAADPGGSAQLMGVSCVPASCIAVGGRDSKTLTEQWDGTTWTVVSSPTPQQYGSLQHVSCVSATNCTAVGINQSAEHDSSMLVETWDGTAWRVRSAPSPDPFTELESRPLFGLDCHAGPSCALAYALNNQAYVAARTGTTWSRAAAANGNGNGNASLRGVSCAGAVCAAVGSFYDNAGRPFVEWFDGTSWQPKVLPLSDPSDFAELESVSCAAENFCVAVGVSGRGDSTGLSEVWNGRQWRAISLVPAAGTSRNVQSVSCPAVNLCYAAGAQYDQTTFTSRPLVERFDGRRWRVAAAPNGTGDSFLEHISCATTSVCAVDGIRNGSSGQSPFLAVGAGAAWTVTDLTDNASLDGLTCASATSCFATGATFGRAGTGLIERYDGSTWTAQPLNLGRGTNLGAVACRNDADCLLVGSVAVGNHGVANPVAATWDGISWVQTAPPVAPSGVSQYGLEAVSPSGSTYVAAGVSDVDVTQPLIERYG